MRSFLPLVLTATLAGQTADQTRKDSIVVTGVWQPLPLDENERPVRTVQLDDRLRLLSNTFTDLLRLDSSVDLWQRGANGIQADISIRGGTFGQTLVLMDGMRLNDVQSGHHNLNLPAPLESVGQVEIMKGSGSALYGSDAVGGVVHFITRQPEASEVRLRAAAGNFGVNQQRAAVTVAGTAASQELTVSRDFSTGFIPNRDYRNLNLGSTTRVQSRVGWTTLHLSHRDSPFGAEQFYGNFNSWERTKAWWAAARQSLGTGTDVSFAYRRHTDLFVLYRDRPQVFTNRHAAESWQLTLRRRDEFGQNATFHYGAEGLGDEIVSSNLGQHSRGRGAVYAALDLRAVRRFSFSAGVRDEFYGSGKHQISPSFSTGVWLRPAFKLRASVSRAFRLPTYTDLYYQDPANIGSPHLRPERAWSYDGGLDWKPGGGRFKAAVTVFHRRETDGIDYVRASPSDVWRATNFQNLNFTGVEISTATRTGQGQHVEFSYTGLRGAQEAIEGQQSKYVFNYPQHTGIAGWTGSYRGLAARTRLGVTRRLARDPYALWDLYGASTRGPVRPFLQLTNLNGAVYQEIPGVAMQGRAVVGGIELVLRRN
ncbi:MAG TPA: TonB-dependent receptor [Bryobacteraceae bacterium]|nr:TonB-dependent receptor [Bryobacteraceae bacterium]